MEKCLHKYLLISLFLIITGFGFLWFGLQPTSKEPRLTFEVSQTEVRGIDGERAYVTKVVDGDTIVVNDKTTVRFVGIDTPETVDPRRPVGCYGKEASNEVKRLLTEKQVILQKDVSDTDKYKRILRYIYLPLENGQILFVNDYLVREGFAKVLTYPPDVKYDEQLRGAEKEAKINKRGLWGKCY